MPGRFAHLENQPSKALLDAQAKARTLAEKAVASNPIVIPTTTLQGSIDRARAVQLENEAKAAGLAPKA